MKQARIFLCMGLCLSLSGCFITNEEAGQIFSKASAERLSQSTKPAPVAAVPGAAPSAAPVAQVLVPAIPPKPPVKFTDLKPNDVMPKSKVAGHKDRAVGR